MDKIVFIGSIQLNSTSTGGGVQTKNHHILDYILNRTNDVIVIDSYDKNLLITIIRILYVVLRIKSNCPIIFSLSSRAPYIVSVFCNILNLKRRLVYFVPGGNFADEMKVSSNKKIKAFKRFEYLAVQANYIENDLRELGFNNTIVVPNFKKIIYTPVTNRTYDSNLKLVFISRIKKEKGVDYLVEAIKQINDPRISLDFYGTILPPYSVDYFESLRNYKIEYKGFLDLTQIEGYQKLSEYDVLVFPTFFKGEGFPGTLLDSFIAGVPAIATDYHANGEIIQNGVNGILIAPEDTDAIKDAILKLFSDKEKLFFLRANAIKSASSFNIEDVLNRIFIKIGVRL